MFDIFNSETQNSNKENWGTGVESDSLLKSLIYFKIFK